MFKLRSALALAGLAFGIWEAVDIFWISTPAVAAVMATLFLGCTIWYWHPHSLRAAVALGLLFAFEAAVAPTLKAMTVTKAPALALALVGLWLAVGVIVGRRRRPGSAAVGEAGPG